MSIVVPVVGLLVAPAVGAGVYLHAARSGRSRRESLLRAGGVAAISFAGFLVAYSFGEPILRGYVQQLKPVPVATSPYEAVAVRVAVGAAVSGLGLLLYWAAHRYGTDGD